MLVHDRDAEAGGGRRVKVPDRPAGERDGTGVGLRRALCDAHQRRLARSVLAEKSVNLPREYLEGHVRQRGHARVRLTDSGHDQSRTMTHVDLGVVNRHVGPFDAR